LTANAAHEGLTDRQARLLALVVRDYVETAKPVSSERLVRRFDLSVSAATVRNELAALEDLGLLTHPHTSAGRQPTVAGYRYFVEHLMLSAGLVEVEKRTIRHQFHQAGWDPERWMRLAAAVMAQTSGVAALVAAPRQEAAPLRRVEFLDTGLGNVQVVVLLADGTVCQARWRPAELYDQVALDGLAARVNTAMAQTGQLPALSADEAAPLEASGLGALRAVIRQASEPVAPRLYHAGLAQILGVPEFHDGDQLRCVVELLEHGQRLEAIIHRLPHQGVHVIIGGEPPLDNELNVTLILAHFGTPATQAGVLGIVGPTRMPYERAVPTVGFIARLMTRLLAGQEGAVAV
jgi:heat-inducible transcriptional repressor